eukprot:scaffold57768_cov25-Tisochrysis_lutea.AAC.7
MHALQLRTTCAWPSLLLNIKSRDTHTRFAFSRPLAIWASVRFLRTASCGWRVAAVLVDS